MDMIKTIDSYFAGIESGKANIKNTEIIIKKLSETPKQGVFAQIIETKAACSKEQFFFAAKQAIAAASDGTRFSDRLEIELLLRITATRQIGKAIEIAGIKNTTKEATIIALSKDRKALEKTMNELAKETGLKADNALPEKAAKKNKEFLMKEYGIKEKEMLALKDTKNALENAIIERMALNALNQ